MKVLKEMLFSAGRNFDGIVAATVVALILDGFYAALMFGLSWAVLCFILEQFVKMTLRK